MFAAVFLVLIDDPLQEAIEECEYLSEPLRMAFGPNGLGVMLPDITGLTITRIGSQILQIFDRGDSPIRDMLLNSSYNLETVTGDGIKTFFILLNSLLKNIQKQYNNSYRFRMYNQFKQLLCGINCLPNQLINNTNVAKVESDDLDKIISCFFYTRFTSPVAVVLSSLFKKWIKSNETVDQNDRFSFLLNNFDALIYHKHNSFPLDESKIVEGVTLSGHYCGEFPQTIEQALLKVLYYPGDNKDEKMDVNLYVERTLNELVGVKDRILFVVNNDVPGEGKHILRERGVNLLMHAEAITTKLLAEFTLLYRSKYRKDPVVNYSCDVLSYMTNITIEIPIFQLQICAPTKSYMKSYNTSLRDCLRLCRFTLDTISTIIPAGQFERVFAMYFASIFGNNDIPPVNDRVELLKWHKNIEEINEQMKNLCILKQPENLQQIIVNICLYLKSLNLRFDNEVVNIICESMMEVGRRIPEEFNEVGYEPLSLKLTVIQKTLTNLLMLMNIDKVLSCKKISSLKETEFSDLELSDSDSEL